MTIDLRTGVEYAPRREDYITKQAGCTLATAPTWDAFLLKVTGGDQEMVDYLQRVRVLPNWKHQRTRHVLFVWNWWKWEKRFYRSAAWDSGNVSHNGSNRDLYCAEFKRHPTDLAGLMGARLVTAIETEEEPPRTIASSRRRRRTWG
jgi:putative DNA primase/helicase